MRLLAVTASLLFLAACAGPGRQDPPRDRAGSTSQRIEDLSRNASSHFAGNPRSLDANTEQGVERLERNANRTVELVTTRIPNHVVAEGKRFTSTVDQEWGDFTSRASSDSDLFFARFFQTLQIFR